MACKPSRQVHRHARLADAPTIVLRPTVHAPHLLRFFIRFLTFGFLFGLAGCVAPKTKTDQTSPKGGDDEYVTVTETGSRVSRRVKKSELSNLQSPDLQKISGQGWSTAGGDGGNAPSAAGKGR
jgi:hypothetical protein